MSELKIGTPLTKETLKSFHGVGGKSATLIAGVYDTVEELASADPKTLAGSLKIPNFITKGAVMGARDILKTNKEIALGKAMTSTQPAMGSGENDEPDTERMYVTRSVRLDPYTVKRFRIPVTESTCVLCGFDGAITMGSESYDGMNEEEKAMARQLLNKHLALHDNSQLSLIRESQMPKSTPKPLNPLPIPQSEKSSNQVIL